MGSNRSRLLHKLVGLSGEVGYSLLELFGLLTLLVIERVLERRGRGVFQRVEMKLQLMFGAKKRLAEDGGTLDTSVNQSKLVAKGGDVRGGCGREILAAAEMVAEASSGSSGKEIVRGI